MCPLHIFCLGHQVPLENKVEISGWGLKYNEGEDKLTNSDGERTVFGIEKEGDGSAGTSRNVVKSLSAPHRCCRQQQPCLEVHY